MKAKIYSLSLLLACSVAAMAIAPQKRANVANLQPQNGKMIVPTKEKSAVVTKADLPEGTLYLEDFEEPNNSWTLVQTPGESEDANGIYISNKVASSQSSSAAASGEMYLIGDYDKTVDVNHWAISKGVDLKAGEYYVSAFFQAYDDYGDDQFRVCMGTVANSQALTTVLIDNSGENFKAMKSWTLVSEKFTVESDGTYFFGWNHFNAKDGFFAAMDYFRITIDEPIMPSAKIAGATTVAHNGAWSLLLDSTIYLPHDSAQIGIQVETLFADEAHWTVEGAKQLFRDSTIMMVVSFPQTGEATLTFEVKNDQGTDTEIWKYKGFVKAEADHTDMLSNFGPGEKINALGYGLNKNYKMSYAEGYDHLDEGEKAHLTGVNVYVYDAWLKDYADSAMTVRILGPKLGEDVEGYAIEIPDDEKVLGSKTMTWAEFLGNEDAFVDGYEGGAICSVQFDKPVNVEGTYFVAIDMFQPDTLKYSLEENYIAIAFCDRGNSEGQNVLSKSDWLPYTVYQSWNDEDAWVNLGEYYRAIYIQRYGVDYTTPHSLAIWPVVTFGEFVDDAVRNVEVGKLSVYPSPVRDILYVENLNANAEVAIMDVTGRTVATYTAASVSNGINVKSLSEGVYVVSVKDAAGTYVSKFVKK